MIDKGFTSSSGDIIGKQLHYSSDGTLKLIRTNWPQGILDFTVVNTDRSNIEVLLRFKVKDKILYLDTFKATGIARGMLSDSLTAIEYRIPKYSYMLNVPVHMNGMKSESDKEWDELLATLSEQDQKMWREISSKSLGQCITFEELLNRAIPNDEKRKQELERGADKIDATLNSAMADAIAEFLSHSKISTGAQKKIVDVFRKQAAKQPKMSR